MIRHTHRQNPQHTVVAYSDNAAVMEGHLRAFEAKSASGPGDKPEQLSEAGELPMC
jgi:phosphoribosylformylglycinamidine synthase